MSSHQQVRSGLETDDRDPLLRAVAASLAEKTRPPPSRLGRYRVHEVLGAGGMGIVCRATDEMLQRDVALKLLAPGLTEDAAYRERFLREARVAAALTHPNIGAIYDTGTSDGWVYIAMELVHGRTLRAYLADGALTPHEALRIAREIAAALACAHVRGIVHRDVKPENVMVLASGGVKVLDFGLAKREQATVGETVSEIGAIVGTPAYMSPEQASGKPVDVRSDVFSFGVMLYELATGQRPFSGATSMEIAIAIARDQPRPPSQAAPHVHPDLERVMMRCLAKDPAGRYANAGALLADLERARPGRRPRRRWPAIALAGVAAAAGTIAWWQLRHIALTRNSGK